MSSIKAGLIRAYSYKTRYADLRVCVSADPCLRPKLETDPLQLTSFTIICLSSLLEEGCSLDRHSNSYIILFEKWGDQTSHLINPTTHL